MSHNTHTLDFYAVYTQEGILVGKYKTRSTAIKHLPLYGKLVRVMKLK